MTSYTPVTAVVRGFEVLSALNFLGGKAGIGAVHARTGIPKPTIVRLFETLIHAGYVSRDPLDRTYVLTAKTLSLSEGFRAYDDLLARSRPIHEAVRERLVWPSDMAVLDGNAMVLLDTNRHPESLWFNRSVGSRVPILVTALGRAFLAFLPPEDQDRIIALLARSDDAFDGLARDPIAVREMLDETRARGYATSNQEFMKQTRAIALPIHLQGKVIASVNVIVVAEAMSLNDVVGRYTPIMQGMVTEIEAALAGPASHEALAPPFKNGVAQLSR
ncbi:MAG: helix-turn-helix domain-containing protein [Rhodospirillaceae bacterium]|nr:helix-turn-helix domain-containing protein [Rhodospirillaceae bacterium]